MFLPIVLQATVGGGEDPGMRLLLCEMYVGKDGTYIFCIYIHPAPFVRDAIFPHVMLFQIIVNSG